MAYAKTAPDGSVRGAGESGQTTPCQIVGYRVLYLKNGNVRLMTFRDRKGNLRTVFPNSERAISSMRNARLGTNPRIVPVYQGLGKRR